MPDSTPGQLFVVAAPSGAGKSSLVKALRAAVPGLHLSVSHTTRAPRGQEQDGREYHFVDAPTFERMVAQGAFIEWALVHGNCYGTSGAAIAARLGAGEDVMLEIDYQGALQIKKLFPGAALIFVLPPSWAELERRITGRGEDTPDVIAQRMAAARVEVAQAPQFDYVIINGSFDGALADLQHIVRAQRLRYAAQARHQAATFAALDLH